MIYKDKVTSYRFKNESSPILYVNITGNITVNEVNTVVETLRNTSSLVNFPSSGVVYKNINVWVGTGGFGVPRNIKEGIISFRVKNIWMDENNLTRSDVNMLMWNGVKWLTLVTVNTSTDGTYTYYESKTNTFSEFAISGFKNEPDSNEKPIMTSTPKPIVTSNQTLQATAPKPNEVPGFGIIPVIFVLFVLRRRL
jgi:PGF-pre-PGF domain-containing protein